MTPSLKARLVIIRSPLSYNGRLIDKLQYQQMVNRAGRMGFGESIIICKSQLEVEKVRVLVSGCLESGCLEPVTSCLAGPGVSTPAVERALLELVVSGVANCEEEVEEWADCTLVASQGKNLMLEKVIPKSLAYLEKSGFISTCTMGGRTQVEYAATSLGEACIAASLDMKEAVNVYEELFKAREMLAGGAVLHNLHLLFLTVSSASVLVITDWLRLLDTWERLGEDLKKVGCEIGVEEQFIVKGIQGTVKSQDPQHKISLGIHKRFFTALALHQLAQGDPLSAVADSFGTYAGEMQRLQSAGINFSGMVALFCQKLGWKDIAAILIQFQDRQ